MNGHGHFNTGKDNCKDNGNDDGTENGNNKGKSKRIDIGYQLQLIKLKAEKARQRMQANEGNEENGVNGYQSILAANADADVDRSRDNGKSGSASLARKQPRNINSNDFGDNPKPPVVSGKYSTYSTAKARSGRTMQFLPIYDDVVPVQVAHDNADNNNAVTQSPLDLAIGNK
jgi:hypothetical protein